MQWIWNNEICISQIICHWQFLPMYLLLKTHISRHKKDAINQICYLISFFCNREHGVRTSYRRMKDSSFHSTLSFIYPHCIHDARPMKQVMTIECHMMMYVATYLWYPSALATYIIIWHPIVITCFMGRALCN